MEDGNAPKLEVLEAVMALVTIPGPYLCCLLAVRSKRRAAVDRIIV